MVLYNSTCASSPVLIRRGSRDAGVDWLYTHMEYRRRDSWIVSICLSAVCRSALLSTYNCDCAFTTLYEFNTVPTGLFPVFAHMPNLPCELVSANLLYLTGRSPEGYDPSWHEGWTPQYNAVLLNTRYHRITTRTARICRSKWSLGDDDVFPGRAGQRWKVYGPGFERLCIGWVPCRQWITVSISRDWMSERILDRRQLENQPAVIA